MTDVKILDPERIQITKQLPLPDPIVEVVSLDNLLQRDANYQKQLDNINRLKADNLTIIDQAKTAGALTQDQFQAQKGKP